MRIEDDIMGFTRFKGHYCLKCQSPRHEAIGAMPRCEQCGSNLEYVEVSHTPAQFAGYFFLACLLLLVLGVIITTLAMAGLAIVILASLAVVVGIIFIICILLNKSLMKAKIAQSVNRPRY